MDENSAPQTVVTTPSEAQNTVAPVYYTDAYIQRIDAMAMEREALRTKKPPVWPKILGLVMLAILTGIIAGGTYFAIERYVLPEQTTQRETVDTKSEKKTNPTPTGTVTLVQSGKLNENQPVEVTAVDVSPVVDSVMPAVVAINNYATQTSYDFWSGKSVTSEQLQGSGSGIIIGQNQDEVLIVTNNHVVSGSSRLNIVFCDHTVAEARIKGTAASSDLAVVAVPFSELSADTAAMIRVARIGNSDEMKVGEMAIAIGNALGYGQSVTVGYISALDREITIDGKELHLIQTDAAINPGNSGGALLNKFGEVIAINSAKYSDYSVEGMGFAIPISNVREIIDELSNREQLTDEEKGFLGIADARDITENYASALGMPRGVCVQALIEDSPAVEAGILVGDIIVKIGKETVTCMEDVRSIMGYTRAGTEVTVIVARRTRGGEYEEIELSVTLGSYVDAKKQSEE